MRIFHIATVADWDAARRDGHYTTSTRGRSLAEEGFIHASRGDQWQGVRDRFYADVTEPLVLLVIDTARLTSPVVDEPVGDSDETFPHVYGPIDAAAVVQTLPVTSAAVGAPHADDTFTRFFLREMLANLVITTVVLVVVMLGTLLGTTVDDRWGPLTGAGAGLVVGLALGRFLYVRRARATAA